MKHNGAKKQICSSVELTVKTLRCLPRDLILQRVNKSKRVNHKLVNVLGQTFPSRAESGARRGGRLKRGRRGGSEDSRRKSVCLEQDNNVSAP